MTSSSTIDTISLKKRLIDFHLEKIRDLSMATGISQPTLRKIVSGQASPTIAVLCKLIKVLDLSPSEAGQIFLTSAYVDGGDTGDANAYDRSGHQSASAR